MYSLCVFSSFFNSSARDGNSSLRASFFITEALCRAAPSPGSSRFLSALGREALARGTLSQAGPFPFRGA